MNDEPADRPLGFARQNHTTIILVTGFLLVIIVILGTTLPSPYNFRYAINRVTKPPTFKCSDGIYSFAADTRGACSGHGPITQKLNPDGSSALPSFTCEDGTASYAVVEKGACSGHGGVSYTADDPVGVPTSPVAPFKAPKALTVREFERQRNANKAQ